MPTQIRSKKALPEVYKHLVELQSQLEKHYKDMQDIEFTIEQGKLYLLQTRTGKRSPSASIQIAVDLVHEGLISKEDALQKVEARSLELILRPIIDPNAPKTVIAKGLDSLLSYSVVLPSLLKPHKHSMKRASLSFSFVWTPL